MDEKGIQLGLGKRVRAIVDRSLRTVRSVEYGKKDLVTILETVCADGTVLHPTVVFKGKRRDLRWAEENPADARFLAVSPNGWTDQELGSLWMETDFEPAARARNPNNGYRLLILDGHNSHCTYRFLDFADRHDIIVLCLPAHTTHALQPCDVGVFGPLAQKWKALVTSLGLRISHITRYVCLL
ncbi:CENP-B protein [Dendrothele bispora CBS 962.96]|uniref:CENP-B protein n=1 Tax=Dendrothele bispora (strain CBS 962.96) TaxID=1314807 RepID=A0A4S8L3F0_DENBC|nr:CENP-B protein [Dendrothele bispora CBS 962.96]